MLLPLVLGAIAGAAFLWPRVRLVLRHHRLIEIRRQFHWHRERLEVKFLQLASRGTVAPGAHWMDCEFEDEVAYVRNRKTGQLCALVGIILVKSNMLDISQPPSRCRVGTAIFCFVRNRWDTDGRPVLNLSPSETIRFYQDALEVVDEEIVREG